jgi:hypothetical protein
MMMVMMMTMVVMMTVMVMVMVFTAEGDDDGISDSGDDGNIININIVGCNLTLFSFRELIAEGQIIEGKKNPKMRYVLLFSDLFICTTKTDDSLILEWKVDLCNSEIEILKSGSFYYYYSW